jgi:hypothetical protein
MKSSAVLFELSPERETLGRRKPKGENVKSLLSKAAGLLLAALACGAVLQAQSFESAHWKSTTDMSGGPQGDMKTESEVWMKDKKMRTKIQVMGMNMNVVKAGDFIYQWPEGQTAGMKMPANMRRRGGQSLDYVNKMAEVRTKGKKIGAETVDGHSCEIFEYNDSGQEPGGTTKQTYWLAKDLKDFPVKVVTENGGMKTTTVNHDVELGARVPDSLLTPPNDVKFQDMSEMTKGMPAQKGN